MESFEERVTRLRLIGDTLPIALFGIWNIISAALRVYAAQASAASHAFSEQVRWTWVFFFTVCVAVVAITVAFVKLQNALRKLTAKVDLKTSQQLRASSLSLAYAALFGIMTALSFTY